jgi:hypothetical protein
MKLEFSRQIFEKFSNINFHEIGPEGAELIHADGQTDGDGRVEVSSPPSQFSEGT